MFISVFSYLVISFLPVDFAMTEAGSTEWIKIILDHATEYPEWADQIRAGGIEDSQKLETASCRLKVNRPEENDPTPWHEKANREKPEVKAALAVATKDNRIECLVKSKQGVSAAVKLSLAGEALEAWGGRFTKNSFYISGKKAETLFYTLASRFSEKNYNEKMYHRTLMCDPMSAYCFEDLVLNKFPLGEDGAQSMGCDRDGDFTAAAYEDLQKTRDWKRIWGVKKEHEALQDQIDRGVREITRLTCTFID